VNVLAIYLVEDHPGHAHVAHAVEAGLAGRVRLLAPDMLPLRARWVMTSRWGIPRDDADAVMKAFLEHPRVEYVGADRAALARAFALADELSHDVYDTFYLALAQQHGADGIMTTDAGLRAPCEKLGLTYDNPVPRTILRRFSQFEGQ
jgi:predicted nucleic acid-binding protein